ncbi:MAG: hypothetical protein WCA27_18435, partial [Candidatus Sulfotelmatobacter sp.]
SADRDPKPSIHSGQLRSSILSFQDRDLLPKDVLKNPSIRIDAPGSKYPKSERRQEDRRTLRKPSQQSMEHRLLSIRKAPAGSLRRFVQTLRRQTDRNNNSA